MSCSRVRASAVMIVMFSILPTGCASMFVHGGRLVGRNTPLDGQTAAYTLAACVDANGAPTDTPALTYHVLPGENGPELFERSSDGSGTMISNRWEDTDGTHYFAWGAGFGWEYVVPAGGPGVRRTHQGPGGTDAADGTRRPVVSQPPASTCQMLPTS